MVDLHLTVLVSVLQSQFDVLAQGLAFLLCEARHDSKQHLSFGIHRVNVLFLKENRNVLLLQFPDIFQAVQRIPGKTADGFRDDHINPASHVFLDHTNKLTAFLSITAADSIIRKYPRQLPFWILLDELGVMLHLHLITACLFIAVRGNTAVSGNPEFRFFFCRHGISHPFPGEDNSNVLIQFHTLPPRSLSGCRHKPPAQKGHHRLFLQQAYPCHKITCCHQRFLKITTALIFHIHVIDINCR